MKQELLYLESKLSLTRTIIETSTWAQLPQLNPNIIGKIVKHLDTYPNKLDLALLLQVLSDICSTKQLEDAWRLKMQLAEFCQILKVWLYPVCRVLYCIIPAYKNCHNNQLQQLLNVLQIQLQLCPYVQVLSLTFYNLKYIGMMVMLSHYMVLVLCGYWAPLPSLTSCQQVQHITFNSTIWAEVKWLQGLKNWDCLESLKFKMGGIISSPKLPLLCRSTSASDGFQVLSLCTLVYQDQKSIQPVFTFFQQLPTHFIPSHSMDAAEWT
jgi:hypothetical protein